MRYTVMIEVWKHTSEQEILTAAPSDVRLRLSTSQARGSAISSPEVIRKVVAHQPRPTHLSASHAQHDSCTHLPRPSCSAEVLKRSRPGYWMHSADIHVALAFLRSGNTSDAPSRPSNGAANHDTVLAELRHAYCRLDDGRAIRPMITVLFSTSRPHDAATSWTRGAFAGITASYSARSRCWDQDCT
jgi:hypothetical protein